MSNTLTIDIAGFFSWVMTQENDAIIGFTAECGTCPIAYYIRSLGAKFAQARPGILMYAVDMRKDNVLQLLEPNNPLRMFMREIDSWGHNKPLTKADILPILIRMSREEVENGVV